MSEIEELKKLFDEATLIMEEHEKRTAASFARLIAILEAQGCARNDDHTEDNGKVP